MTLLLEELLHALSPAVLRAQFVLPHDAWREEFLPRFLTTTSHDELVAELGRFVAHLQEQWFGNVLPWPREHAETTARRLLTRMGGELAAMRRCRHADHGGLRTLLDDLERALQEEALTQYLDCHVMPMLYHLTPAESLHLAEQYLHEFNLLPDGELESPAGIALRWRQVVHQHAQAVLNPSGARR